MSIVKHEDIKAMCNTPNTEDNLAWVKQILLELNLSLDINSTERTKLHYSLSHHIEAKTHRWNLEN